MLFASTSLLLPAPASSIPWWFSQIPYHPFLGRYISRKLAPALRLSGSSLPSSGSCVLSLPRGAQCELLAVAYRSFHRHKAALRIALPPPILPLPLSLPTIL
ncbi:hypothetical protein B0H13DRAFT_2387982 [Mycena leptocephala]|nr:hypothetical protein B0H13DRAFT_2387982 [Mycena leptocephala]